MSDEGVMVGEYRSTPADLLDLLQRPAWQADALCREHPELAWFAESGRAALGAKEVCSRCLVRTDCESYAMADPGLTGIWGGWTARERSLRRRSSHIDADEEGLMATA
jgi:WhiB family redox-sensing transcriptional regulator